MALSIAIGLLFLGVAAFVVPHDVVGDVVGTVLVIGGLVAVIRSVIPRAGEAGTPGDQAGRQPGSSPERTSRFR
jgi:hypothetical protein